MCGIAGIVDFRARPIHEEWLWSLCDGLAHRGPDDRGVWQARYEDLAIGLASTRLAILDPSPAGHQPMVSADGSLHVVFNGLLYNFRDLRRELAAKGYPFQTECDTEVVLAAYGQWGARAFERFNGMWAVAVYDEATGQGLLVRDRFGIKPLVYVEHDQRLLFASELKALEGVGDWPDAIDPVALTHYLRLGFVPHPQTLYASVRKLEPGHLLRFGPGGVSRPERWYHLPVPDVDHPPSYDEACAGIRERVEAAVAARTVADVPLGAFLSGGVDSSIVVAHLARHSPGRVKTFSIGFVDQARYDETRYARMVAEHFGTEHHEFRLHFSDIIDSMPGIFDHLGEPFADSSLLPTALVSRYTREHVTVALAGDGSDELFGGYWRYLGHHYLERYRRIPAWVRRHLIVPLVRRSRAAKTSRWANRVRQARKLLRADSADPLLRHIQWSMILSPEAETIFRLGARQAADYTPLWNTYETAVEPALAAAWNDEPMQRILLTDLSLSLPADMLHKVDLASMAHGLEVRVPFLDPAVVEYATSLPVAYKLEGTRRKRVLIDAHRDLLPPGIADRPKMGFEVPIGEFLRRELRDMFHDVVDRRTIDSFGWLDFDGIHELYQAHCRRQDDYADLLYALLVLCWWRRRTR